MDTTDPDITFDENGFCNYCQRYDAYIKMNNPDSPEMKKQLDKIVTKVKKSGRNKEYDCVIGLSGGVDSSYVACKVMELGLRPLAIHFDSGWNSEIAVSNIEKCIRKLNLELYTVVCDWEEMRDLTMSFLKASVANCDIPQDHAFYTMLFKTAKKLNIKYIISGHNMSTESIMPVSWGYNCLDLRYLLGIHKRFGSVKLKNYPKLNFFNLYIYYPLILGKKMVPILDYMPFKKQSAKEYLRKTIDWKDYGGKHHESIWTRFFQAYYLPKKFGYDRRKPYLSSLIISGQMTKDEALTEMKKDYYPKVQFAEDKDFILKKLNLTDVEFDAIMDLPKKTFKDYSSNYMLFQTGRKLRSLFRSIFRIQDI
jgi:N-acetyl sugar amidotransferase